ncbi:MAG: polysaccharide deacetylase family protein [Saprospiraceae bacterium]
MIKVVPGIKHKRRLVFFYLLCVWSTSFSQSRYVLNHGAIIRGDSSTKQIALIFSGDEYGEGLNFIQSTLKKEKVNASFFFTGRFYRNKQFIPGIKKLLRDGHFLGPHSDRHVLYCDWVKRDSLLITKNEFIDDLHKNYESMNDLQVNPDHTKYFLPPYEWYNDSISSWAHDLGVQLINFTSGTLSHTDYTTLKDRNYRDNQVIFKSIIDYENKNTTGLNGFILLMHIGAGPDRKEKFFTRLPELIKLLKQRGYHFSALDQLLK